MNELVVLKGNEAYTNSWIIAENIISQEVDKGTYYKEIYQVCKAKCQIIKELAFLPSLKMIS
ncbi:MAG TPA: hypothetical protein GX523_15360 [Desulfitobacterium dehalogenans]|uniref:Uncharacterized protein n=1 Tax=Desulfitobacterium dehalogenans TaxID=36854 RepID=A0A7C7D7F6_9FIRM|nr:hypothetical protein [Desulfitobacterium dehalogenans]